MRCCALCDVTRGCLPELHTFGKVVWAKEVKDGPHLISGQFTDRPETNIIVRKHWQEDFCIIRDL